MWLSALQGRSFTSLVKLGRHKSYRIQKSKARATSTWFASLFWLSDSSETLKAAGEVSEAKRLWDALVIDDKLTWRWTVSCTELILDGKRRERSSFIAWTQRRRNSLWADNIVPKRALRNATFSIHLGEALQATISHLNSINHLHEKALQTQNGETLSMTMRHQTRKARLQKLIQRSPSSGRASRKKSFEVKLLWMTFSSQPWTMQRAKANAGGSNGAFSLRSSLQEAKAVCRSNFFSSIQKPAEIISNWLHERTTNF